MRHDWYTEWNGPVRHDGYTEWNGPVRHDGYTEWNGPVRHDVDGLLRLYLISVENGVNKTNILGDFTFYNETSPA